MVGDGALSLKLSLGPLVGLVLGLHLFAKLRMHLLALQETVLQRTYKLCGKKTSQETWGAVKLNSTEISEQHGWYMWIRRSKT